MSAADPATTALFLGAFFDELTRWGVYDVVVSPGSRSTPLAMTAYELSRRAPERLRLFVDVDERGAAFFALGMAKASGRPAAVICTSGTAVANYYPAVMEAKSSRVPLVVLTGDRPPRLQELGAPQTCDQLKAFGDHVRAFRQMPLPTADAAALAFARQAAREAVIAAGGGAAEAAESRIAGACLGGPVHLNFPFDEPLKPDFSVEGLFEAGRRPNVSRETFVPVSQQLAPDAIARVAELLAGRRALALAGEGTCATDAEARDVLAWAHAFNLPLLADPLSGLRRFDDALVIDNYDSLLSVGGEAPDELIPEVIVRFGRYPVSKKATQFTAACGALQVVVDPLETRDCNAATDVYVPCEPVAFARSLCAAAPAEASISCEFADTWTAANDAARERIVAAGNQEEGFEGSFVRRILELAPEESCLFAANSMSIRALDTFYLKGEKRLTVLCNRGLNGIDGTTSTALGAAQSFAQTTFLTGDLTLLHDLNALALQRELRVQRAAGGSAPSIIIVLLNNNGGAIFDMLPQKSEDAYFERLFLTPQDVNFEAAAQAFAVRYQRTRSLAEFDAAYKNALGTPGITLIEVPIPLQGLKSRYAPCW
ncbi:MULTISPECIES: 2-succinyl-5-enolpyruvyl-6-hydroxy-3-cyclohexene-1-carboxylic-acid synthase [Gordonibacter]|uniref:2-succinyl-5-enolpyruvyl-6-hydroxy-3-cyclohexene-1-carboxylate synthase n=1 Tax=Gordonibacter faecis TaxID=3047475 RepID=A0ABT7DKT0_9ACTN|nr:MULTISPECIES: 2-succinyl-5-enolpyruvyl-6-hydroxy-3-cyclohexene-1-carboxylic-acid synthase [unclassified Gordonibacter]MDJ1650134.1 2-succinyl-5-enolpyruvyl-6-hydroxy-3-cyclohexene-1-carboxylic-acid synthase [Gordonibacter sp. KGMB12511]HIW75578.1 2-succinyl-5-enolpyruvyl-6-hydroxy-3-cyclohexene-1-carboxylic-acid synthase [Candidatus Gordonibacter avicola]